MRAVRYNEVCRKVISVPHTGTRFVFGFLNCHHRHIYEEWDVLEKEIQNHVIVVPLRDPRLVWQSWINWIQPNAVNLRAGDIVMKLDNFQNCWERLGQLDWKHKVYYVPIDHADRDKEISLLSEVLDETIAPDWSNKVGHYEPTQENKLWQETAEYPQVNWNLIYSLPMVNRFY